MCGLVGIKFYDKGGVDAASLEDSIALQAHRGPDSTSQWISPDKTVGLAHARLSIIDLVTGQQPLSNQDGNIQVIVNGEFYDYARIRNSFISEGYQFKTESDSELLIPLYLKYGTGCLEYLRGEFSFILWDKQRDRLFSARDRFGVKPLYYSVTKDCIMLASECKSLFKLGLTAEWDGQNVHANDHLFLLGQADTLFKNISQVKPGHYLLVEGRNVSEHEYWDLNFPTIGNEDSYASEEVLSEQLLEKIRESIQLRLQADVPVGAYLSGGIDSSFITGLASMEQDLDVFTIQFKDKTYDESAIAQATARHNNVPIHCLQVNNEMVADNFAKTIWHSEMTAFNAHGTAKYLLSKHVSEHGYKVVLTGEGADELFGGYAFFVRDMLNNSALPEKARIESMNYLNNSNKVYGSLLNADSENADNVINSCFGYTPHFIKGAILFGNEMRALYSDGFLNEVQSFNPLSAFVNDNQLKKLDGVHALHKTMYLWFKSHFPNYILNLVGDRMEMAHSIEGRVPFLDHHLAEFVMNIPASMKIKGTNEKYILKRTAKPFITPEVYHRQKQPFVAPPICFDRRSKMNELVSDYIYGSHMRGLPFYEQRKVIAFFEKAMKKTAEEQKNDEKIVFLLLSMCLLKDQYDVLSTM